LIVLSHYAILCGVEEIAFASAAVRQWRKLTATTRAQIDLKLTAFAETGVGDVKALKGVAGMRLRAGDWRVLFRSRATPSQFTRSDTAAIFATESTPWQKPAP
jgi:mRNA interferase RelE/StbE